jgi:hypothetical protein
MSKRTRIFDQLDNVLGNYMDRRASVEDVVKMVFEVNAYLHEHPHPHDLIGGTKVSHWRGPFRVSQVTYAPGMAYTIVDANGKPVTLKRAAHDTAEEIEAKRELAELWAKALNA